MSDLKKVGLIFKEDGSADFVKSIRSVNAELRENYQQMKITQASWDGNTKASDKLKDKLVNLTKQYDLYDKKLVVLNEELKELKENENATEDQIKSKEAQIASTEAAMKRYGNNIDDINKKLKDGTADIEAFGKKMEETGDKITGVGKKMSVFSAAYSAAMGLAIKRASDWETAWVDVLKVTDGTEQQLNELSKAIRNMSQELPVSAIEIAGVVEAASKLGVGVEHVESFAETMVKMEIATGISAADSATAIARFAEITKMSFDDVDRLGSVIAELGDNYATTEKEIIDMGMGLAAAGSQVGMHQSEIMALATALSSVGLEAQAGGSAMSKLMIQMELATQTGEGLTEFANVAGVSGAEFAKIFEDDATKAISMFITGLDGINAEGGSAIKTLDDMGIKEVRLRDTLLRAANASETFTGAIEDGSKAWRENTKLNEEAEIQADTLANQIQLTKNMLDEIAITFGEIVMPVVKDFVAWIQKLLQAFQNLSPGMQKALVIIGAIVAAVGPLLIFIGKIISSVGVILQVLAPLLPIIKGIGIALTGPLGIVVAIGAAIGALALIIYNNWESIKEWTLGLLEGIGQAFGTFKEFVLEIWTNIKDSLIAIWDTIFAPIVGVLESIAEFFKNIGLLIIAVFAIGLERIWEKLEPFVEMVQTIIAFLGEFISNIFTGIGDFVTGIIEKIQQIWETSTNFIKDNVIAPLVAFFTNIFNSIWGVVEPIVTRIKSIFETVGSAVTTVFTGVRDTITNIFSAIGGIIKAPVNGIIAAINAVLRTMNKIKVPKWVPGFGGAGINFSMIPMLAKGGNLLSGSAIVGERGPELLTANNGAARVTPLTSSGGVAQHDLIDYKEMGRQFSLALQGMKFVVGDDGFARLIDERLLEVL